MLAALQLTIAVVALIILTQVAVETSILHCCPNLYFVGNSLASLSTLVTTAAMNEEHYQGKRRNPHNP